MDIHSFLQTLFYGFGFLFYFVQIISVIYKAKQNKKLIENDDFNQLSRKVKSAVK